MSGGGGDNEIKPTAEEKELSKIAIERWNDYQSRLAPFENEYGRQVQRTEGDFARSRGEAVTAGQQAFAPERQKAQRNLFQGGVRPGSGSHVMGMGNMSRDQAQVQGVGAGESHMATQASHLAGLQNMVNIGQGQAATAQAGLGRVAAGSAGDAAHRASISAQNRQSRRQLVGTLGGAGARYGLKQYNQGQANSAADRFAARNPMNGYDPSKTQFFSR